MKRRTKILVAVALLCLALTVVMVLNVVGPPGPHFVCHRALDGSFQQWMLETTNGPWFPNVEGKSADSLALLIPYFHEGPRAFQDYRYIPGLRSDDPESLILVYVRVPSRRTWHGDTHWFRKEKRWVILNPRASSPDSGDPRAWSECGEAIPSEQFKTRLTATLEYLKRNGRSGWQAATDEHMQFLRAIKE